MMHGEDPFLYYKTTENNQSALKPHKRTSETFHEANSQTHTLACPAKWGFIIADQSTRPVHFIGFYTDITSPINKDIRPDPTSLDVNVQIMYENDKSQELCLALCHVLRSNDQTSIICALGVSISMPVTHSLQLSFDLLFAPYLHNSLLVYWIWPMNHFPWIFRECSWRLEGTSDVSSHKKVSTCQRSNQWVSNTFRAVIWQMPLVFWSVFLNGQALDHSKID